MYLFKAILKLCSFSFCIWFYVFAPGSHCFVIDIFEQIWDLHSPLPIDLNCSSPIFNLQKLAGSKVTAAKLGPKKSKFHLPNWMFKCVFHFFTFLFHVFFFQVHFQNAFLSHFSQAHFQNAFFTFFTFFSFFTSLWNNVKICEKMRFENALGKNVKNMRFENVNKMWKLGTKGSWTVPVS